MKGFSIVVLALFATLSTFAPSAQAFNERDCDDTHDGLAACGCDGTLPAYAACGAIEVACTGPSGGVVNVDAFSTRSTTIWSMRLELVHYASDHVGEDGHTWTGAYYYGAGEAGGREFVARLYADGVLLARARVYCG